MNISSVKCFPLWATKARHKKRTHEFLSSLYVLCACIKSQPWVSLKRVYDDTQASGLLTLGLMAVITTNLGAFAFGLSSHTCSQSVSPDAESVKRAHATNLGVCLEKCHRNQHQVSFSQIQSRKNAWRGSEFLLWPRLRIISF